MYLCIVLRLLWRIWKYLFCLVLIVTTSPVTEIVDKSKKENMEKSFGFFFCFPQNSPKVLFKPEVGEHATPRVKLDRTASVTSFSVIRILLTEIWQS